MNRTEAGNMESGKMTEDTREAGVEARTAQTGRTGRQAEASALLDAVEADAKEYGYGERTCMNCGKTFIAMHFAQICCCEECKKERKKARNRQSLTSHMAKLQNRIQQLENELAVARGIIEQMRPGVATEGTRPVMAGADAREAESRQD